MEDFETNQFDVIVDKVILAAREVRLAVVGVRAKPSQSQLRLPPGSAAPR